MLRTSQIALCALLLIQPNVFGDAKLLREHCGKCHLSAKPKGDFALTALGSAVNDENLDYWVNSLDLLNAGDMPPAKGSKLSEKERSVIADFLQEKIRLHDLRTSGNLQSTTRRLNNRELANSVSAVLMIEDVGTHQPIASLLGDTLQDGFDTNGDALGFSEYHLDQYITAFRKILDATLLPGDQPPAQHIDVHPSDLRLVDISNRRRGKRANRTAKSIDILDLRKHAYFANFDTVPATGRYPIKIRAAGIDRNIYSAEQTGFYEDDPIRLRVHMGDRVRDFDLPDNEIAELEIDEWLAAGTTIRLSYLTDTLRLNGNGNFKFQYRIARDYIYENDRELYDEVVRKVVSRAKNPSKSPDHWSYWTDYWQGPRPRLYGAEIVGPIYESWPPQRHVALIGSKPNPANAEGILAPIARRAWKRDVNKGELSTIADLVRSRSKEIGVVEAFKEGVVAILVSPSFLLTTPNAGTSADRFATKLSYFLTGSLPSDDLRRRVAEGKLDSFDTIRAELQAQLGSGQLDEFLNEFPNAWLQLDRINFMAPDPDQYPMYEKKRVSEDMTNEVLAFFDHAVRNNLPVPELLTADYSFLNADLARVYGVKDVLPDSKLRKYIYSDGRRGGLLGMGAFLTLTADSLGTSPIHRAVYVMENYLGIHPAPPPGNVEISEPDVRQAKTIKEVLKAHREDPSCLSCHQSIDPYGYAFENFDPVGAWRDDYTIHLAEQPSSRRQRNDVNTAIPIDASAEFRNGSSYQDIVGFRQLMKSDANRDRFLRCFITKLLTYANGAEPKDFSEVEKIVQQSGAHEYRIVDTIAAVIDSPLFREQ